MGSKISELQLFIQIMAQLKYVGSENPSFKMVMNFKCWEIGLFTKLISVLSYYSCEYAHKYTVKI